MKKLLQFTFILFLMFNLVPSYEVEAASNYTVEMVANQTGNKVIGSYSSYSAALNAMNAQNSTANSVATIYRDGVPVDSKYGIFKFKPGKTYNLYTSATGSTYTSIHGSYGTDAALLGYSENGRVKVMISGYIGWTEVTNGVVTPISLMGVNGNMINVPGGLGIRIRKTPSLKGTVITQVKTTSNFSYTETRNADGYTWYKISYNGSEAWIAKTDSVTELTGTNGLGTYYNHYGPTGNLIHHFTYYNGSGYGDTFTNLGTAPSYLAKDVRYYSFDGNYFYADIMTMLDDYRSGVYTHSINYDSPHYAYYLYLSSHSVTGYTAEDFDEIISNKGYNASTSKMFGTGKYFKEAEATYGQNALMMFGTAMNESANGTSKIAMDKNNLFGYGAADSCAYDCAYSYDSPRNSIMDYAKKTGTNYSLATGKYYYGSHYGNKASGRNVKYATDPYWGEKQAGNSFTNDLDYGGKDFNSSTIGVVKKDSNVGRPWVFDKPERTDEAHVYTLKNPNSNEKVNDLSVNVVDKVVGLNGVEFYKIYTDLPADDNLLYGYVPTEEIYVSNNQPVISASDKTIKEGDNFNPLEGVSASDAENGNLTGKITYESDVKPEKEGTYHVTYTVSDNSNFHVNKTITVKVISAELPIITAEDKEVKQFEEFDYMDGVSAKAYDGTDLTDDITYEQTVNTDVADTYEVTYKVKDSKGKEVSKTINVTVIPNEKPVINASDKEIYLNSDFDPLEGVTASDAEDGPIEKIEYKGEVKTDEVGDYKVTYIVTDKNGQKTEKTITVKVIVNQLPVINVSDKTVYLNSEFDPLDGVTAYDPEDGTITKINVDLNEVKTNELGQYKVTYSVTDSYEQTVTKTITVTVSEKVLEEKDGEFYLDGIKWNDNSKKYEISGYLIQLGAKNGIDDYLKFQLVLENKSTNEKYNVNVDRWTNDLPYDLGEENGYDYRGAWFKGEIDLSGIPQGDYDLYMRSVGTDYYSETLFSNILNSSIDKRSEDNKKGYNFYVNLKKKTKAVELSIRDGGLISTSESPTYRNMINDYDDMSFEGNCLKLIGTSYNYGVDYSNKSNIDRKVYLENVKTFDLIFTDIDSTNQGSYSITSLDNLSKEYAWYNGQIDVSQLEKGTYAIIIDTKVGNVEDYGYVVDMFNAINEAQTSIDGKNYKLVVNTKENNRVELVVS